MRRAAMTSKTPKVASSTSQSNHRPADPGQSAGRRAGLSGDPALRGLAGPTMSCKIIQATITRPLRPTIVKIMRKVLWVLARCICCSSLVIPRRNARSMSVSLGRSSVMVAIPASLNEGSPADVADPLAIRQRCLNVPPVPA
jgi:hypothetical protein